MVCGSSNIKKIDLRYPEKNEVLDIKDIYVVKKKNIFTIICCKTSYGLYNEHYEHIFEIIKQMNIDTFKKRIIIARFINLVKKINSQVCTVCYTYNFLKFFQQTGSILLPSIISIQGASIESNNFQKAMYWGTWGLSLTIGLLTNWIHLFKLDKKFVLYTSVKAKLEQEFWLYISLTGRYGLPIEIKKKNKKIKYKRATHKYKIDIFLQRVEDLYKKLSDNEADMLLDGMDNKQNDDDDDDEELSDVSVEDAVIHVVHNNNNNEEKQIEMTDLKKNSEEHIIINIEDDIEEDDLPTTSSENADKLVNISENNEVELLKEEENVETPVPDPDKLI